MARRPHNTLLLLVPLFLILITFSDVAEVIYKLQFDPMLILIILSNTTLLIRFVYFNPNDFQLFIEGVLANTFSHFAGLHSNCLDTDS